MNQNSPSPRLSIRAARAEDEAAIVALWNACGLVVSHNDPHADFRFARAGVASDVLVAEDQGGLVVGSIMIGHDGHRGWLYYLAADPAMRLCGIGGALIRAAEDWLRKHGVRKTQLLVRQSNAGVLKFYERLGFEQSTVVVMQRWIDEAVPSGPTP